MAKNEKRVRVSKHYDFPLNCRLRELVNKKNIAALAERLSVTQDAVRQWQAGYTRPDIKYLVPIARYFRVTTDYLLGITNDNIPDLEVRAIADKTGLSGQAAETLVNAEYMRSEYEDSDIDDDKEEMWTRYLQLISCLLESQSDIWKTVGRFSNYCDTVEAIGPDDGVEAHSFGDMYDHFTVDQSIDSRKHEVVSTFRLRDFRLYELMKSFEDAIKEKTVAVIREERMKHIAEQLGIKEPPEQNGGDPNAPQD